MFFALSTNEACLYGQWSLYLRTQTALGLQFVTLLKDYEWMVFKMTNLADHNIIQMDPEI